MSAARDLFESIITQGYPLVEKFVANSWGESSILDFKLAEQNTGPMTTKDRLSLSECLSGFANSEGGVIFWGVHCRSFGPYDPDVAQKLKPISQLRLFLSDLQRYTPQIVSPGIAGVEHQIIEIPDQPDRGFAVTYVPRGEGEPHMAKASKEQYRFYYRSGTSFLPMEPFMLADRYGRRPHPRLALDWCVEWDGTGAGLQIGLTIGIRNEGLGIAMYPALALHQPTAFFKFSENGVSGNGHFGLPERPRRPQAAERMFAGGANDIVHPGTVLQVTRLKGATQSLDRIEIPELICLKYGVYCQGFSQIGEVPIRLRDEFNEKWPK